MDTWYAAKGPMPLVDGMRKTFYCPLKSNRRVDDSGGERPYQQVNASSRSEQELKQGKQIKTKGSPKDYEVKLFRVVVHPRRTERIASPTIFLGAPRRTRKRRVPCAGGSRGFTARL